MTQNANEPQGKASGTGLGITAILLSMATAAGGFAYLQQQQRSVEDLQTTLQQQLDTVGSSASTLQSELQTAAAHNSASQEQALAERQSLNQQVMGLSDTFQLLRSKTQWNHRDWSLAEIHYLVQIAADRLHFMRDSATALAALQTAANRVDRMAAPELQALRQQLQSDMTLLRAAGKSRADNPLENFEATLSQLRPLPAATPPPVSDKTNTADKNSNDQPPAEPAAPNLLKQLKSAISERYRVIDIEQPLNPLERSTIPQQQFALLQLRTESLRHALASHNPASFEREVLSLKQWNDNNLQGELQVQLQTALNTLKPADIFPELPTLHSTLSLLRGLLQPVMDETEAEANVEATTEPPETKEIVEALEPSAKSTPATPDPVDNIVEPTENGSEPPSAEPEATPATETSADIQPISAASPEKVTP